MSIAIGIGIFLSIILFVEGGYYCYYQYISPRSKAVKAEIEGWCGSSSGRGKSGTETLQLSCVRKKLSDLPWLNADIELSPECWDHRNVTSTGE